MAGDAPPPPWEPPLAAEAPAQLTSFIYLIGRDLVPLGYLEKAMMDAVRGGMSATLSNPELAAYAERLAKALTHKG